jgi:hypothetical protein
MIVETVDLAGIATAMSITKRGIELRASREQWPFESRPQRGGPKRFYPVARLPADVRAAVMLRHAPQPELPRTSDKATLSDDRIASAWQRYERVPQHLKDEAAGRLRALQAVEQLVDDGHALMKARQFVADQLQREGAKGTSCASLSRWAAQVAGAEKQHRLALLVPAYTGRSATAEIPVEAWDLFKTDYLRVEAPSATSCYERLQRIAQVRGWELPSLRTFERRITAELPRGVLILARQGREAFDRTFPAQERDRSVFHALEAVNADGHKFDVFVRWPDGTVTWRVSRPTSETSPRSWTIFPGGSLRRWSTSWLTTASMASRPRRRRHPRRATAVLRRSWAVLGSRPTS